nr:IS6 family transposase [Enterococcus faecium]HDI5793879.1 IS6 family transposase [Enterococcus faecium]
MTQFKGKQFQKDVIIVAVGYYLRYNLSYREVQEILYDRGIHVCHTTIYRWVQEYGKILYQIWKKKNKQSFYSWKMDETYIKIKGKWHYLYRAIDVDGLTLDIWLRKKRDTQAAYAFLKRLKNQFGEPKVLVTDKAPSIKSAFRKLQKNGLYITTERERYYHEEKKKWVLGNNIYTLISNPKKFQEQALKENDDDKGHSRIRNSGMKSLGYGTVPKAVMLDRRLDIQAKGIYVYFCGFAGSGNSAFPKLDNILYHLQISKKTYYKYYNQLVKTNYIEAEQRQINGRLGVNDYYLNENPDEEIAKEIAKKRVKVDIKPILPCSKKQDIQKQDIQKQDIYNTNRTNTNSSNINSSNINSFNINSHSFYQEQENLNTVDENHLEEKELDIREIERLNLNKLKEIIKKDLKEKGTIPYSYTQSNRVMEATIKILTEYDHHMNWYKENKDNGNTDSFYTEALKLFNEALSEMLTTQGNMFLKGSVVTYSKIYDRIVEGIEINENYMSIGSVLDNSITDYREASSQEEIYSPLNYMKSVIWNALLVGDIKMTSDIERTFGNGRTNFY